MKRRRKEEKKKARGKMMMMMSFPLGKRFADEFLMRRRREEMKPSIPFLTSTSHASIPLSLALALYLSFAGIHCLIFFPLTLLSSLPTIEQILDYRHVKN